MTTTKKTAERKLASEETTFTALSARLHQLQDEASELESAAENCSTPGSQGINAAKQDDIEREMDNVETALSISAHRCAKAKEQLKG